MILKKRLNKNKNKYYNLNIRKIREKIRFILSIELFHQKNPDKLDNFLTNVEE